MTRLRLIVLVPAFDRSGPVLGAIALCNGFAGEAAVDLVSVKGGTIAAPVDPRVRLHSLAANRLPGRKLALLRRIVGEDAAGACCVSFCFSADVMNLLQRSVRPRCSSVRGNLRTNYAHDYGWPGYLLAAVHHWVLKRFDVVTAMTRAMDEELGRCGFKRIALVGNFVDEPAVPPPIPADAGPARFLFLGSLTSRKRPDLVLSTARALAERGRPCEWVLAGDGPLRAGLEQAIREQGLASQVRLAGSLPDPAIEIALADFLFLPSESEGQSRASLECLHAGVPCILRRADGSNELITDGQNGFLFDHDADLPDTTTRAIASPLFRRPVRTSLLPARNRQAICIAEWRGILERERLHATTERP